MKAVLIGWLALRYGVRRFQYYYYLSLCGYHVPEPTRLGKMSKPLQPSRHRFWKDRFGNTGDCHV